jgi:glycosyltransferase involved in cell wall biosynthesis
VYRGKRVLLMTGAFNEEGKIGPTVRKVPWDVVDEFVVVDDGSTDRTGEEAAEAGATVLRNEANRGPGSLTRRVQAYALERGYDVIVAIAGDDQDDPSEIPRLLDPLFEGYDLVQGSRYLQGVPAGMPAFRRVTTALYTLAFRLVTGRRVTDASNGFRAYDIRLVRELDLSDPRLDRYEFEPYMLIQAVKRYRVKEVPVSKRFDRKRGYSKMRPVRDWYSILRPLLWEGLGRLTGRSRPPRRGSRWPSAPEPPPPASSPAPRGGGSPRSAR